MVFRSQTAKNESNSSSVSCNCCNLFGILCIDSGAVSASIPCSPIDYDWSHRNWAAVTLLPFLKFRAWTEPDLSASLDGGSWQRTEQQHIREHQLVSSETLRVAIVFRETQSVHKKLHIISLSWTCPPVPGEAWTKMSSTTFVLLLSHVPQTGVCEWVTPLVC